LGDRKDIWHVKHLLENPLDIVIAINVSGGMRLVGTQSFGLCYEDAQDKDD